MNRTPNKRVIELEIMKGVMVMLMILLHTFLWFFLVEDYSGDLSSFPLEYREQFSMLRLISMLVILIPAAAGATFYFYLKKRKREGKGKGVVGRCLSLLVLGYVVNFVAWGLPDLWAWDVLQFISLSFLALFMFSFVSEWWLAGSAAIILFLSPIVSRVLQPYDASYPIIILISNESGMHYWAFFPWFTSVATGYLLMRLFDTGWLEKVWCRRLFVMISVLAILISLVKGEFIFDEDFSNLWGPAVFLPPTAQMLALLGLFVLFFLSLHGYRPQSLPKWGFLNAFSKGILWIYIFHLIIGYSIVEFLKAEGLVSIQAIFVTLFVLWFLNYLVGIGTILVKDKIRAR